MASRHCAHCGRELTDAASMDYGIGPWCRQLENRLLALTIPADVRLAVYAAKLITFADLPEAGKATMVLVRAALELEDTKDWRTTVKRVEWLLSLEISEKTRDALISIVDALGYISLASLLHGEAAKGKATITFEKGKLFLKGPNKKAGRLAIKKIDGRWFYPKDKRWSVPAKAHEEFKTVVWKHWPNHEGLEEAVVAAADYKELTAGYTNPPKVVKVYEEVLAGLHPGVCIVSEAEVYEDSYKAEEAEAVPKVEAPKVVVTTNGSVLKIESPYNKAFKEALKAEIKNWKDRRWNPAEKVWEVAVAHADLVKTLVAEYYGEQIPL